MLTKTGKSLLQRYLDAEQRDQLKTFRDGGGREYTGIALFGNDGGQLAAAKKLDRDGYAELRLGASNRNTCVSITEKGRAALAAAT